VGTNGQRHEANGKILTSDDTELEGDYGEACTAHMEPECAVASPPEWCASPWCYVDPCFCDQLGVTASTWFNSTVTGGGIYWNYETCAPPEPVESDPCEELDKAACDSTDGCEFDAAVCRKTAGLTEAQEIADCTTVLTDKMGPSECRCLGNHGQTRLEVVAGGEAIVKATVNGAVVDYAYDYGNMCVVHEEPGEPGCDDSSSAPSWCSKKWCYVDPCTCKNFAIAPSDYFPGTDTFFSYAVCGETDDFTDFGACKTLTTEETCTADATCLWDKHVSQCFEAPTLDHCGPRDGNANRPCLNDNLQPEVDGMVLADVLGVPYPGDYGEMCTAHEEPGAAACQGPFPPKWCLKAWCYVDPCTCKAADISSSDYFSTTRNGMPLYYSYQTCGSLDDFEVGQCEGMVRPECEEDPECELLDSFTSICTKKDSELLASRKDAICVGYEQEVIATLQFPMTTEEVTAVDAASRETPEVELAFVEGLSLAVPSVPTSSIKVVGLGAEGTIYIVIIEVRRPYGEADTIMTELDAMDKGAVVDGVTDALVALGVTVELTDVTVQDSYVLVYPNRDTVPPLPLPAKPTGLETTEPDDRTSGTTESGGDSNTTLIIGGGVVLILICLVGGYFAMQSRKNTQVAAQPEGSEPAWTEQTQADSTAAEPPTEQ
jgi:hypothetical protein